MKYIYLILLGLFITSAASAKTSEMTYLAPDFVIGTPPALSQVQKPLPPAFQNDCRARISTILCQLPALNYGGECKAASTQAIQNLENLYDTLQPQLQKVFCTLDKLLLIEQMESLALAGVSGTAPDGSAAGAYIAIRKDIVENDLAASAVLGWKEQKSFGIKMPSYQTTSEGPQVEVTANTSLLALRYVMTHEFAHVLDFANTANNFVCAPGETCGSDPWNKLEDSKWLSKEGSWSSLSWKNRGTPRDDQKFPLWSKLCFYGCKESLAVSDIEEFYREISGTNFITTYAAVSPWEDFAESSVFYFLHTNQFDLHYRISTKEMVSTLDWKWSNLKKKNNWIETFYEGPLKYPEVSQ